MKIRAILGAFLLLLVSGVANAALVRYTVTGDLNLFDGTDAYSLNGSSFVLDIKADTSLPHIGPDGQIGCCQVSRFYGSLSSDVTFTNRSNGASDTTVATSLPRLWTVNADNGSGEPDLFEIRAVQLTGEFETASMGGFFAAFDSSFYEQDGFATLPEQFNFSDAFASGWGVGVVSNLPGVDLPFFSKYSVSNLSMSVSPVPIPAAAWLFGTALIGLVGVSRRRRFSRIRHNPPSRVNVSPLKSHLARLFDLNHGFTGRLF